MITVLESGALNTVQDLGRPGYRGLGVGVSGAMDALAVNAGNILLGNAPDAACIELQTFPFALRIDAALGLVVTGAECAIALDGRPVLPWFVAHARPGQVLTVAPPRRGARGYVCVTGGLDVPVLLGSRATQLRGGFGGHAGRPLAAGDALRCGTGETMLGGFGALQPELALPPVDDAADGITHVRAIPATDHHRFTAEARQRFWHEAWRITPQSDRVGYRLSGEALSLHDPCELRSYGIVPGIVQVPPAGQPIVQMADANTAGGYPRLACVIEADLWRLAQARIGSRVRFHLCDHAAGVAAMRPIERWLDDLRVASAQYRRSQGLRSGVPA